MRSIRMVIISLFLCLALAVPALANVSSEVVQLDLANGSISLSEMNGVTTYTQGDTSVTSTGGCLIQQTGSGTESTAHTITITSGNCAVTIANLNVNSEDSPIDIQSGSLKLTLLGESTLVSANSAGIAVPEGTTLEIKGAGLLNVTGGSLAAGIGGAAGNAGTITVNGGTITAIGGTWSAGIGGGKRGNGGNISINSGTIVATGGEGKEGLVVYGGAGIGGGAYGNSGVISISGGDVTATGKGTGSYGYGGAGIGGGNEGSADSVTISNGTVTAVGGRLAAGIGGGNKSDGGTIVITGGIVTADSGYGYSNYSTIYGGAGIGGGSFGDGGTITIKGGEVNASSTAYGAGIGGGVSGDGGTITISGGDVTAKSTGTIDECGAGIGGGHKGSGGSICINGGTVHATSFAGAGIGGGVSGDGGIIHISDATVTARATHSDKWSSLGPSAIGGGAGGKGGTVTITDSTVTASGNVHAIGGGNTPNKYGCDAISVTNSIMTLSFALEEGFDYQEEIKNLSISQTEVAALLGSSPSITTEATSFSGISSYQWRVSTPNGLSGWPSDDIEGQTASSVSFAMLSEYEGEYVNCKITNVYGNTAYTSNVQLYELAFTQQPTSVEAGIGDLTTFSVASSCANVTYQWQKSIDDGESWMDVANGTNSILGITTSLSENGAQYRCVITSTNGNQLISEVATVTVQSTDTTYTVLHYLQTPDGASYIVNEKDVIVANGGDYVEAEPKAYPGFSANMTIGVSNGTVTTDNSLTLTLYYNRITYSIEFVMNGGGEIPNLEAPYGSEITQPNNPSRYGYTFKGWYADEDLTTEFEFKTMPLNGAIVYAAWEIIGYDRGIEYIINGISVRDSSTYERLNKIPEHSFLVEVSITNISATTMDTIIIAQYTEKGQMIGMQYLYANPQIGQTLTFGAFIENADGKVGLIKAFVLPTLGNPIPLAESVELRK